MRTLRGKKGQGLRGIRAVRGRGKSRLQGWKVRKDLKAVKGKIGLEESES